MKWFAVLTVSAFLFSCGGKEFSNKSVNTQGVDAEEMESVDDPFEKLQKQANQLEEEGALVVVGEGQSTRRDIAKEKAIMDAQGKLVQRLEVKVSDLRKRFVEEVSNTEEGEISESFSAVTKSVSSKSMSGAKVEKVAYFKQDDKYVAGIIYLISAKDLAANMKEEIKKNSLLDSRLRSDKKFEELIEELTPAEK